MIEIATQLLISKDNSMKSFPLIPRRAQMARGCWRFLLARSYPFSRIFGERNNGSRLLNEFEEDELNKLLKDNPDMKVTVPVLVSILISLTSMSPSEPTNRLDDSDEERRGRVYEDESAVHSGSSRSSSRGPSNAPKTPNTTRVPDSPFDSERRQRTAPLQRVAAPSSWHAKRQAPTHRRSSDAGMSGGQSFSDSEVRCVVQCFTRNY